MSPPDETPRPGRPRDPAKDDAAIQATLELLAERGFHDLRIDDVAARARVPKSTIYRRWPSLHALVVDAYRMAFPTLHLEGIEDPLDALDEILAMTVGRIANHSLGPSLTIAGATIMQAPDLSEEYRNSFIVPYWVSLTETLERGVATGRFVLKRPVEEVASMLFGQWTFSVLFLGERPSVENLQASARALVGIS